MKYRTDLYIPVPYLLLFQSMNSVSCDKLIIDRQRAPKNIPTFANISTFASFSFPREGDYKGGFTAQSLAGRGKTSSKKKNSRDAVASNTGATTLKESLPREEPITGVEQPSDTYAVQFIQHVPEPVTMPTLETCSAAYVNYNRPQAGFALKKSSGVRMLFTAKQKEIMIEFFNRQHSTNIRSKPEQVNEALKRCGEKELKDTQIKGFWSTYSQKRKRMIERIEQQMNAANNPETQAGVSGL